MRLDFAENEPLEMEIQLLIQEDLQDTFIYEINPIYRKEVYRTMLKNYRILHEQMDHVVLLDFGDEILEEFVYELSRDRNYLTIVTDEPQKYEEVLEKVEREYGLVGMVFTESRELGRYLKSMPRNTHFFVAAGCRESSKEEYGDAVSQGRMKTNVLYQLPKKSFFMDFSKDEFFCSHILKKRMDFTYVNIPIFLDNTVKNRYNAVVNEGITFQVINEKTFWRRKGNKDGRKEEYSDL